MGEVLAIPEFDAERDRKTCIALDLKTKGANEELAQWLLDHPRYSGNVVANWLGCHASRIRRLRIWAKEGFLGSPYASSNRRRALTRDGALATNENFEDDTFSPDESVEDPSKIVSNILDSIKQSKAVAEAYRKILKVSPFDREAKKEISNAIKLLIRKWRAVQSTLATRGKADGEQDT